MPTRPRTHKPVALRQHQPNRDQERNQEAHRKLLWTAGYRRFREVILTERPACEDCRMAQASDIHHVRGLAEHPGDLCDPGQVLALCHGCHSRRTARGE